MMSNSTSLPTRKIDKGTLLLWATIAASIALSIVSAYETFVGLLDFMTDSIVGTIASGILTFGIQVLLFVISWSIANHFRDGFRANGSRWAIWILCAFFSGYFSYYGFLATTGGRDESIRLAEINSTLSEVNLSVYQKLEDGLGAAHQEEIAGDMAIAFKEWLEGSPKEMISIANSRAVNDQIISMARDAQYLLIQQRQNTQNLLDRLIAQRVETQSRIASAERRIERLQLQKDDIEARYNDLRAELRLAESEHAGLVVEYEQEIKTGVGRRAHALELDVNSALGRVSRLTNEVETVTAELETAREALITEKFAMDQGIEQNRLNDLRAQISSLEGNIAEIDEKLQDANQAAAFDVQSLERKFDRAAAGLINLDYSQLEALTQQCSTLKQQLIDAGIEDKVAGISCSNFEVVESVGRLTNMQDNLQDYQAACMQSRTQPLRPEGSAVATIQPMITEALTCVNYVTDLREREVFVKKLNTLNALRGDNTDPITMASVALFKDRQGNAVMSAVFALIVDFLVLLCALVGTTRGLPERVRAIDLILSLARSPKDSDIGVEKRLTIEGLEPNQRAMINPIINDLVRQGLANFTDDHGDKIDLLNGAVARLSALRSQDVSDIYAGTPKQPVGSRRRLSQPRGGRD